MGLRDIQGIRRLYALPSHESALDSVLIPCLKESVSYDRAAGYFNSHVFSEVAPGISEFARRQGKFRLLTSHHLSRPDTENASRAFDDQEWSEEVMADFENVLREDAASLESKLERECTKAMCWMLKKNLLEIRIVLPADSSERKSRIFHPKFGIFRDGNGDELVFSGSTNETRAGWTSNLENISTYPLWENSFQEFSEYKEIFDLLWQLGEHGGGWVTRDLPDALRSQLIAEAPDDVEIDNVLTEIESLTEIEQPPSEDHPRSYQLKAVEAWVKNDRIGILAMATGSGKTRTARYCIEEAMRQGSLLTVITTPFQHISDQWVTELQGLEVISLAAVSDWKQELQQIRLNANRGRYDSLVISAVNQTASRNQFVRLTQDIASEFDNFLFIGDEVHWLGATDLRQALNPAANFRLGLSATHKRYRDEVGTEVLQTYFNGEPVYNFTLREALEWVDPVTGEKGILTPYEYVPIFVELTDEEALDWWNKSQSIFRIRQQKHQTIEDEKRLEDLYRARADIAKKAEQKLGAFRHLISSLGAGLDHTIVYAANEEQLRSCQSIARVLGVESTSSITAKTDAKPRKEFGGKSERGHIIEAFSQGAIRVLFAMRALDEGVDIPTAQTGIIIASSGNSKEFIQRRGRLMRKYPGKEKARIFDFVVLPPAKKYESLRRKELERTLEFAEDALNSKEALMVITSELGELSE